MGFVGVDVGTTSARAGVFDPGGRLLAYARQPIAIWREAGDMFEYASADIWAAACAAVREAVGRSGLRAIDGLGFDATCSLVALDARGESLPVGFSGRRERDTIVWMDHRAEREAAEISARDPDALRFVGGTLSPEMQAAKLMWLKRHAPDTFAHAQFFDLADFLTFRATGSPARSLCTVTCKWPYVAPERRWATPFFERVGLTSLLSDEFSRIGAEIVAPGSPLGRGLSAQAAQAMGLRAGTPVGAGLIDAHAGALATLGAGGGDPERRLALILGTSGCCMALSRAPRFLPGVWGPSQSALLPGYWLSEGGQSAFGAAIDQLLSFSPAPVDFAELEGAIIAEAGSASRAALFARDLHVVPDFLGNRSPFADAGARAAIAGLGLQTSEAGRRALYVAGLCGLAQSVAQVVAALERGGFAFDLMVASGGASHSALVRQIVADALGRPVARIDCREPVLLGAAMLGATAAGLYSLESAMAALSHLDEIRQPAGGEIAEFHACKRAAFEALQRAERETRAAMQGAPRAGMGV